MSNVAYPFPPATSGIPTQQLQTWSNQGSVTNASNTRETIYNALKTDDFPWHLCEIYLQGSYGNDTNTHGNSDVDVVAEYTGSFFYNDTALSPNQRDWFNTDSSPAPLSYDQFHTLTVKTLKAKFGKDLVKVKNKAIKIIGDGNRLPADVVPCFTYKHFTEWISSSQNKFIQGVRFIAQYDNPRQTITNFPKQHRENATQKNSPLRTEGRYKPTVRMFKNARRYLVDRGLLDKSIAPSYFLECLLYNVPDDFYVSDIRERYQSIVGVLKSSNLTTCMSQNGIIPLFGRAPEQWSEQSARTLINALDYLWNNWDSI